MHILYIYENKIQDNYTGIQQKKHYCYLKIFNFFKIRQKEIFWYGSLIGPLFQSIFLFLVLFGCRT